MPETEIWNRFNISDKQQPMGEYVVSFLPRELMQPRNPDGSVPQVSQPARVTVATRPTLAVTRYTAPERPVEGVTEVDYRKKAIEEVARNHPHLPNGSR